MAPRKPNILLLFTDQHVLSAVGCYGPTVCRTPNIDRLAATGARFETAYTVCPVCSPARATIMTGVYPHRHGINSNTYYLGTTVHTLEDRPGLLSRRLEAAGYGCGYSGKWHLGGPDNDVYQFPAQFHLPSDLGFVGQDFPGHGGGGFGYPEYQRYLAENGWEHKVRDVAGRPHMPRTYGVLEGPTESTVPYFLAENTIRLMERFRAENKPFFVWHNFWGPHEPCYVPASYYELYHDAEIPESPTFRWNGDAWKSPQANTRFASAAEAEWEDWAELIRHYYAFTTLIDDQIGRILRHLETTGEIDNTVILFTADHGKALGDHGGLLNKGWSHFEEIQRIPFVAWVPEALRGFEPGTVFEPFASNADVYPTILDLAGTDAGGADVHGRSLVPLLRGEDVSWPDEAMVEFTGLNWVSFTMITFRQGHLKYGWNVVGEDELYDLRADPQETRNLIRDPAYADALGAIRTRLMERMEETGHHGWRELQKQIRRERQ